MGEVEAASNLVHLLSGGAGAGGGVLTTLILLKFLNLKGEKNQMPPGCPLAPNMANVERKLDDMIQTTNEGNLILSEIKGILRERRS